MQDSGLVRGRRTRLHAPGTVARNALNLAQETNGFPHRDPVCLRMDAHAQLEIRSYAETIGDQIVSRWVPQAWEAFKDYRFNRMTLSQQDQELLALLIGGKDQAADDWCKERGWVKVKAEKLVLSREAMEFADKLAALGMVPPWES